MLTAFDVGVGILVLISAILATARGLTREVLSLATWAGSAALAIYMWQYHPEVGRGFIKDPTVADIATVVVTFIVALIVLHLITMRIADFVVDSRIGPLDRTLGFVFGVLRGILIAVVLVIFGQWLLGANLPPWASESKSLPMLQNIGNQLIAALPDDLEQQVTDILEGRTNPANDDQGPQDAVPAPDDSTDAGEDSSPLPATSGV
jgi:membrane protein required for colicin V production